LRTLEQLHVGDIVICHGHKSCEGKKGFVEEIVTDTDQNHVGRFYSGRFSIYGLEKIKSSIGNSLYYGDFLGEDLESTNNIMSIEDLQKYKTKEPDNKGLQSDIEIVIRNYGRTKGRNEDKA